MAVNPVEPFKGKKGRGGHGRGKGSQSSQKSQGKCFNCGEMGHYWNKCPQLAKTPKDVPLTSSGSTKVIAAESDSEGKGAWLAIDTDTESIALGVVFKGPVQSGYCVPGMLTNNQTS